MMIKILVADDEPNQLELLSAAFLSSEFKLFKARDGREAVDLAEEVLPDLIILDWMMPNISGIDACNIIKSRTETKKIPIIILSAKGEEENKIFGLDRGADDYVVKPFSPKELVARTKALLRRVRPSLVEEEIEYNGITISQVYREVRIEGNLIYLGPKEYKILSILMERPGIVYSREQLLDLVWGNTVYVEDRTIDVHISRLRKALKKGNPTQKDIIRTVRDGGYALKTSS